MCARACFSDSPLSASLRTTYMLRESAPTPHCEIGACFNPVVTTAVFSRPALTLSRGRRSREVLPRNHRMTYDRVSL